jgi:lipopolysaccharide kinase (Kdo/WaaP) family protein
VSEASRLLAERLPVRHVSPCGTRWLLSGPDERASADQAARWSAEPEEQLRPRGVLLKERRYRRMFRVNLPGGRDLLCKIHRYTTWRRALQHRSRGWSEATNLLLAQRRDVPVPHLFGYCEWRRWGLTRRSGILMERLADHATADALLRGIADPEQRRALLRRVTPLVVALYRAGSNHIDLSMANIMIHRSDPAADRLIDFQDNPFLPSPSLEVLSLHLGRLLWELGVWEGGVRIQESELTAWREEVLSAAGISATEDAIRRIERYRTSIPSRKESLKIREP